MESLRRQIMTRWILAPLFFVAMMFAGSQASASDVRVGVGLGFGDGYYYTPSYGYSNYYPYTYDDYGYYTPTYRYSTGVWYDPWYGNSYSDRGYWRGSHWNNGAYGRWDGRGNFSGSFGYTSRGRHR